MAHESWERCEWCEGKGCKRCDGGRVKPEGWVAPAAPNYARDDEGNILYHEGTEDPVILKEIQGA